MSGRNDALVSWALEHARREVRETTEQQMVSTVRITRADEAVLGPGGELIPDQDSSLVYEGRCHLGTASGPITYTIGDEVQYFSSGSASIPLEWVPPAGGDLVAVTVQINDMLEVTGHDDFYYVGRVFRIVDVENLGTLAGYRRLQIVGIVRSPGWVDSAVRHPSTGPIPDEIPPEWKL